ncbi:MAG: metallophosphoesterase [Myxococcota bacterium]
MRVLQISDTHLGAEWNVRAPEPLRCAGWRRADDHHAALEHALGPALREEVDLVIHAGDVFDRSRPPMRDVERAGELFTRVARRVPVLGIAGNHDRKGIQRWLPHRSLRFVDRAEAVEVGGLRVGLVPFRRRAVDFAADARGLGAVDLLVCHQAFDGSRVPGFTFRVGTQADTVGAEHVPEGVRHIACGHIHPRQAVRVGPAEVVHGGSTERTAFSEADQPKGAVLWDFGRTVRWRFTDHPTRPMHTGASPDAVPGALVRCTEGEVPGVLRSGAVAVVRRAR